MNQRSVSDEAKAVVRRSTEEVQGKGRFEVFEELFADDFVDHTTQPGTGMTPKLAFGAPLFFSKGLPRDQN